MFQHDIFDLRASNVLSLHVYDTSTCNACQDIIWLLFPQRIGLKLYFPLFACQFNINNIGKTPPKEGGIFRGFYMRERGLVL